MISNQDFEKRLDEIFNIDFEKKLVSVCKIDEIDKANIEILLKGKKYPPSPLGKMKVTPNKVIKKVLKFYNKFDKQMGKKIKKIYKENKKKIEFRMKENLYEGSSGFTSSDFLSSKHGKMIIDFPQNYTTYFTVAHEFMHSLERKNNIDNEKLAEVNARFIEFALGDYLEEKRVITREKKFFHFNVNNMHGYSCAENISDCEQLVNMLKNNKHLNKLAIRSHLEKQYNGNKDEMLKKIEMISEMIENKGPNGFNNQKRFVNGMVGANLLYDMYKLNSKRFPKIYNTVLHFGNMSYKDFFDTIQKQLKRTKSIPIFGRKNIHMLPQLNNMSEHKEQQSNSWQLAESEKNKINEQLNELSKKSNIEKVAKIREDEHLDI